MDLITIKKESWLSCPYHEIFLRDSFKVFYIGLVPIFGYAIVIVVFYYLWLAIVITALKIVMVISMVFLEYESECRGGFGSIRICAMPNKGN